MDGIAIVGLAGRFPGAPDIATFWHNLRDGVTSISKLSETDLRAAGVPPSLYDDPSYVRARGLLDDVDMFDAPFFGCTPREAALMDPQHRLFLRCAHEALEDAGCDPRRYEGAIGVYGGASLNTYLLANLCRDRGFIDAFTHAFQAGSYDVLLGNDKDYVATRASYRLGLRGPALTVQTACSTSLVAVVTACQALATWQCDMALAGGVSVTFPQVRGYLYEEGSIMSRDGRCRPFDAEASGTVFGGGVGVVALKRLADAQADGDAIYCVIRGFALNNDGAAKLSYMAPSADGQAEVIAMAHAQAGLSADAITYVEAHGTGTPVGDPIEVSGLTRAFRVTTSKRGFCALGAVKANVGHLEAAAGVTGLIKTALMLRHRTLVPTPHFTAANPHIDFARTPFEVQTRLEPWSSPGPPLRAGVSAFGVGGTNAHVVLEEAPTRPAVAAHRNDQVLVLSARSASVLDAASARLAEDLERYPERPLADVAFTLQCGRRELAHRRAVACTSAAEGAAALRAARDTSVAADAPPPVAFLFPGQGAQRAGMLAETYATEPSFRAHVDACCELLRPHLGLDLRTLLHPAASAREEADARLRQTALTQPALFVTEYALARLWMSWGIAPHAMIGHSVGEYVAACLADVLSLEDALALVAARGRLMQALPPGVMVAVRASESDVLALLDDPTLSIASVNAPMACVVSGPAVAVERLTPRLVDQGLGWRLLATSHAFHSPMMDPLERPFTRLVRGVARQPPRIPFVSNVTGRWITPDEVADERYWFRHLRGTVRFADGLETLFQTAPLVLLEVGPGHTLSNMARQHPTRRAHHAVVSSDAVDDGPEGPRRIPVLDALGQLWAAGVSPRWRDVHGGSARRRVSLPTYPFEEQRCWIDPPAPAHGDARHADVAGPSTTAAPTPVPPLPADDPNPAGGVLRRVLEMLAHLSGLATVEPQARFPSLGFDSLFLAQVVAEVRGRFGVQVAFRELLEGLSTPALLAARIEETCAAPTAGHDAARSEAPQKRSKVLPLSEAQREIWLACQMSPEATLAYNESHTLRLRGPLDVPALEAAIGDLIDVHEAMRLIIDVDGLSQTVQPRLAVELALSDLSMVPDEARGAPLEALIDGVTNPPFDLENGPLVRFHLVKTTDREHHLVFAAHHVACDGWSLDVLLSDLGALYRARIEGRDLRLERPSFGHYVAWDEDQRPDREADLIWWTERYQPVPAPVELPHDRPRPPLRSYRAATRRLNLGAALTQALKAVAAAEGSTLFNLLMASWQAWLNRASAQEDIVVGFPVAGQMLSGQDLLVGQCSNLLPLRGHVSPAQPFRTLLMSVQAAVLDAFDHPRVSFGRLVTQLRVTRDPARVPLVSVHLNLDRAPTVHDYGDLETDVRTNPRAWHVFDLGLNLEERDGGLAIFCVHSADLFSVAQIDAMLASWRTLLEGVAVDVSQTVERLPVLPLDTERWLLAEVNRAHDDLAGERTLADLFETRVARDADALALVFGEQRLSYGELNERANRLAHHLRRNGVGPDACVAVLLDDPVAQVTASVAIAKAGGAFVPLDAASPADRLTFMLTDCGAPLVVTASHLAPAVAGAAACTTVLTLDTSTDALDGEPITNPTPGAAPDDLAYVLYTSGSTGRPKGVEVTHHAVVSFIEAMGREGWLSPSDRMLATCAFTFDVHVADRWLPLVSGVPVVLLARDTVMDGVRLERALASSGATAMAATPTTLRLLLEAGWTRGGPLKVITAGEALTPELAREVLARVDALWNGYGPTEASVLATLCPVLETTEGAIPIGRPLANTRLHVMDARGRLTPPGVPGELWIGGDGVARGYLGRSELTAERFVANPLEERERTLGLRPSPRLYRTGDKVRLRPDGQLEFLGRNDFQVKVRGFRIELGEIEAVMEGHADVASCAVVVRNDGPRGVRLAAFVAPRNGALRVTDLREHLRATLPDYMIPSTFHPVDALPTSTNGKVDRSRLATLPLEAAPDNSAPDDPVQPLERLMTRLWEEVLDLPAVRVADDFFELGGHSLLAMRVVARLQELLGVRLTAQAIFEAPTAERLAATVRARLNDTSHGRDIVMLLDEASGQRQDEVDALLSQIWQPA